MSNTSNRLIVAMAILLLLVGLLWFGSNLYLSGKAQRVAVVAAAVDIPRGSVISETMLGKAEVPRGTEGEFISTAALARDHVARVDILAGTALVPRMLADEPLPPGRILPSGAVIAPGYRAVAVPLDALSVAGGALRAGDLVAVYAAAPLTDSTVLAPPPLAEHVRILDLYSGAGVSLLSAPAGRSADVALLEADPALADLLLEASHHGRLRLVLEGGEP